MPYRPEDQLTASRFQIGVAEAIDVWSKALAGAHERGDRQAAESALDRIALAARLGRREIARSHRTQPSQK
ncbi:hypothetical protein [Microbacterium lacusdiani]|jgi:hypothetical protein